MDTSTVGGRIGQPTDSDERLMNVPVRMPTAAVPGKPAPEPERVYSPHEDDPDEFAGMQPKKLTAGLLNANATSLVENPEFNFYCHQTTINLGLTDRFFARVRIVNLADRALVGTLPNEIRDIVQKLFFAGSGGRPQQFNGRARMDQGLSRSKEIAFAYGCAGFIEPRLVLRPDLVRDPENEAWVGTIALHDLQEFMRICEGDDGLAARRLERFLAGQDASV